MAEYQLDDGNIVFKDTLTERIVDTYFANFSELIDKNHDTISKSFDDMDTVILNFTKTLEQLKAWLKVKLCEAYVNSQVRLDSTEVSELNRIMRNVIRKNFFTKEAKTCSLWNPLRGITIAPHPVVVRVFYLICINYDILCLVKKYVTETRRNSSYKNR